MRNYESPVMQIAYNKGLEDARKETIDIIMSFFPDEPCNYNGMDELADCDYCAKNCDKHVVAKCWENAIRNKWYERIRE